MFGRKQNVCDIYVHQKMPFLLLQFCHRTNYHKENKPTVAIRHANTPGVKRCRIHEAHPAQGY